MIGGSETVEESCAPSKPGDDKTMNNCPRYIHLEIVFKNNQPGGISNSW